MRTWFRIGALVGVLAMVGGGVIVANGSRAEAQPTSIEFCPDLGVLVQRVDAGLFVRVLRGKAIARTLGLRPGDLIFAVNGEHPASINDLHRVLFTGADNEDHDLDILRGDSHLHAAVFHVDGEIFVHTALH
jgi:S1-C subfamily serine protease